jgi:hypothetical protein
LECFGLVEISSFFIEIGRCEKMRDSLKFELLTSPCIIKKNELRCSVLKMYRTLFFFVASRLEYCFCIYLTLECCTYVMKDGKRFAPLTCYNKMVIFSTDNEAIWSADLRRMLRKWVTRFQSFPKESELLLKNVTLYYTHSCENCQNSFPKFDTCLFSRISPLDVFELNFMPPVQNVTRMEDLEIPCGQYYRRQVA